jgi:hypothetical protein
LQADREFAEKSRELLAKLKLATDEPEKKPIVDQLSTLAAEHFDARQKLRDQELKQFEERLKKLRSIHERRAAARAEIVGNHVRQLVRESEGLVWEGQFGPYGSGIQDALNAARIEGAPTGQDPNTGPKPAALKP